MIPAWLPDTVTTDLDRVVSRALLWGIEALELRMIGGATRRVPHVNEPPLKRRLEESELAVASISPGLFEGFATDRASALDDLARLDDSLRFCTRFRCPVVILSTFQASGSLPQHTLDLLRRAGDRAARAGITLALVNEIGMTACDPSTLAETLESVSHPAVAAALDLAVPGAFTAAEAVTLLAQRLRLVRLGSPDPQAETPAPEPVVAALAGAGYTGPLSMVLPVAATGKDGLQRANRLVAALRAHPG